MFPNSRQTFPFHRKRVAVVYWPALKWNIFAHQSVMCTIWIGINGLAFVQIVRWPFCPINIATVVNIPRLIIKASPESELRSFCEKSRFFLIEYTWHKFFVSSLKPFSFSRYHFKYQGRTRNSKCIQNDHTTKIKTIRITWSIEKPEKNDIDIFIMVTVRFQILTFLYRCET